MTQRHLRISAAVLGAITAVMASRVICAEEARTPDASIVVSSPVASALGVTAVNGTLHSRNRVYLLTLRGARPAGAATGKVYNLGPERNIEGSYKPSGGELRNDRGVAIVFDPPLDLPGGRLLIELNTRVHPKASTGQRGTID